MVHGQVHRLRAETPSGCSRADKLGRMDTLAGLLVFFLIGLAVVPLLLLGLYVLANWFELGVADRILAAAVGMLRLQWLGASLLNIVGGLALAALGLWMGLSLEPMLARMLGALLVPFGLWRTFRGLVLVGAFAKDKEAP
jgi:hypothetical protein